MKFWIIIGFFSIASYCTADAQPRVFPSSELARVSSELVGSELNWPLVAKASIYDARQNQFTLPEEAASELRRFLMNWESVERERSRYLRLIRDGAKVFAPSELLRTDSVYTAYRMQINDGQTEQAIHTGNEYFVTLSTMENTLRSNRVVSVEARLSEKSGLIQRREGLLGTWMRTETGSLFKNSDGIRTAEKSLAKLSFVDGSDVILDENTTAIIRNSRIDRLTNQTDVEITISSGGLLTKLSSAAMERSNYQIQAGDATMLVRSSNFWAEKPDEDRVMLANYSGSTTVTAGAGSIQLQENEGTVVVRGQEPLPPVKLLPSPKFPWAGADSVIFDDRVRLRWNGIQGATHYELDISDTPSFDKSVRSFQSNRTQIDVSGIETGISYVRIRAFDGNNLRGIDSPTYRILRNQDVVPPALFLNNGNPTDIYTSDNTIVLDGVTEPGSTLFVNDMEVPVSDTGIFNVSLELRQSRTPVVFKATDKSQNRTVQHRTVIRMTEEQFFDITWSVPLLDKTLRFSPRVTASGTAYPVTEMVIQYGTNERVVPVSVNGNWAIDFMPEKGSNVRIFFRFKGDSGNGAIIAERIYRID